MSTRSKLRAMCLATAMLLSVLGPAVTPVAAAGNSTVDGFVTDAGNTGIQGASVVAEDSNGNAVNSTATAADGSYDLVVPDGGYTFTFDADGYLANQTAVTVSGDRTLDATLDEAAIVSGTVVDGDGNPVSSATVEAWDSNFENYRTTTADGQGSYEFEVPNGTYTVVASASGFADGRATGVGATEGQTTTRDVTLERAATVSGTATDDAGSPIAGATVDVFDRGYETFVSTQTDAQGDYSVEVAGGTYTVRADGSGYARSSATVEADTGATADVDFSLTEPAYVTGTVRDENGNPAGSVSVVLDDGQYVYFGQTNASGGYAIDVPAGDYTVTAFSNSAMGSGGQVSGVQVGQNYTADVDMVSPTVKHSSVSHVGGQQPSMGSVGVNAQVMGGIMMVQLVEVGKTVNGMPHDLSGLNVDDTTTFEINVTVEDYDPNTLLWGVRDVEWSTSPNGTLPNATDITIRTKAVNLQGINQQGLPVGPVQGNHESISWPTGSQDAADLGWNNTVYFGLFDMSNAPTGLAGNVEDMTIATNAQTFSRPQLTDDGLTVYVAGPHLTTYDEEHDGFYSAFIPDDQLDSWGVDDPDADLNALYKGDSSNFEVEETAEGAWIRLDISYSEGTVEIEPSADAVDVGGDLGVDVSVQRESTETPTATRTRTAVPTAAEPTTAGPGTTATAAQATATTGSTATAMDDDRTAQPVGTTDVPGGQPGFGLVAALIALFVLAFRRRGS